MNVQLGCSHVHTVCDYQSGVTRHLGQHVDAHVLAAAGPSHARPDEQEQPHERQRPADERKQRDDHRGHPRPRRARHGTPHAVGAAHIARSRLWDPAQVAGAHAAPCSALQPSLGGTRTKVRYGAGGMRRLAGRRRWASRRACLGLWGCTGATRRPRCARGGGVCDAWAQEGAP